MSAAAILGYVGTILLKLIFGLVDRWRMSKKQKDAGRAEERRKQQEAVDEAVEIWNKIDDDTIGLDDVLDSLRKRADSTED